MDPDLRRLEPEERTQNTEKTRQALHSPRAWSLAVLYGERQLQSPPPGGGEVFKGAHAPPPRRPARALRALPGGGPAAPSTPGAAPPARPQRPPAGTPALAFRKGVFNQGGGRGAPVGNPAPAARPAVHGPRAAGGRRVVHGWTPAGAGLRPWALEERLQPGQNATATQSERGNRARPRRC